MILGGVSRASSRYWEIDTFRGFAVFEMMVYHFLFDGVYLGIFSVPLYAWWMRIFLFSIGGLFLLLVGVSIAVAVPRLRRRGDERDVWYWAGRRSLIIFGLGMLVSVGTFLWDPVCFVKFGVLHCIGMCIVLAIPFEKRSFWWSIGAGSLCIALGVLLYDQVVSVPYFFIFGLTYPGFCSLDFFPLLPWFGVVLWGVAIGKMLYPQGKRRFDLVDCSENVVVSLLSFVGRHSLLVYLLHQPIIVGVLLLLSGRGWI